MDEPEPDQDQACHLDVEVVEPAVVIAAVRECVVNELWWAAAAQRARACDNLPRFPEQPHRVPGEQCPVTGCVGHRGPDDPPLVIPRQR